MTNLVNAEAKTELVKKSPLKINARKCGQISSREKGYMKSYFAGAV